MYYTVPTLHTTTRNSFLGTYDYYRLINFRKAMKIKLEAIFFVERFRREPSGKGVRRSR